MKSNNIKDEQISAFADGEIDADQLHALMMECRQTNHLAQWDLYHHIGDVLRSDEMAQDCSTDFSAQLSARLAMEPAYMPVGASTSPSLGHRWARSSRMISGIAAGAAALYFGGAYLMQPTNDGGMLQRLSAQARLAPGFTIIPAEGAQVAVGTQVVMRDPQIDAYLIAHQQFSPSLYSTAQFARAASFANESAK